ncbi:MAG: glycosyltransferase family 4 protein [Acidobacteria bacterium]|nr:glycosyltransferase family 4 protein [Acidobacteriota bacterium]
MSGSVLRIGVDGRAFSSPAGGVRRYVWELYRAMSRVEPSAELVAVGASDGDLPPGMRRRGALPFPTNLGWMAASIPLAVRGAGLSVYHAPAYTAPLWGVHPQVLTIHDVSYERRAEWNAYKDDRVRRLFYRRSALAADRIVTDSAFSREEITDAYGIPEDEIAVVPLAAAEVFTPGEFDKADLPAPPQQPYVLHVGDVHVRRNLTTALAAILASRRSDVRCAALSLVCAGIDRGSGTALAAQAQAAGDPAALRLLGPVSEDVLLNLYRGASLLAYPSRYEGFGLPILEAMQCGIPVIGARCASIPELVGDAGVLLDPLDVSAWHAAIVEVVTNHMRRAALSAASVARAAQFSWTRTATEMLSVFRDAAQPRTPSAEAS